MIKSKKNNSLINIALILLGGTISTASFAEVNFSPKFEIGHGNYELELTTTIDYGSGKEIVIETAEATFMTYAIGGTVTFDDFLLDFTYKGSASGEQNYLDGTDIIDGAGLITYNDGDFEHTEFAATIGYPIGSFVIFAGYQVSETVLGHHLTMEADEGNIFGLPPGDVTEFFYGVDILNVDVDVDTSGFFAGASYGFPLGESGSLSLTGGLAVFDVEQALDWGDGFIQNADGDGSGLSLAATYNYHLENGRLYFKLDYQSYSHKDFSAFEGEDTPPADADENYYRLSVGYAF